MAVEFVMSNFSQILTSGHEIENLYLHNPPKRVIDSLESEYGDKIQYYYSNYKIVEINDLNGIWKGLNKEIIGQQDPKKKIMSSLYKLRRKKNNKPVVLLFYGPSGVGKTELSKVVSKHLGGSLLRIQFSMMQTNEANNYIFGESHSKPSLAKDLLSRESNIVLIDEFDKVHSNFYNAFYEMFDEGVYHDLNYHLDVKNCIFILTTNLENEKQIMNKLGIPIYSRIDNLIEFSPLNIVQKQEIIAKDYHELLEGLDTKEKKIIEGTDILEWFKMNVGHFDNIRLMNTKLENAIFDTLVSHLIEMDGDHQE
ncbi:AAA family ATPase [Bacillus paranthracis]|uniref:AAA family ATPase n=1 Tax=Bacillus cereus group TaxID=86661 RepID=UPI0018DE1557|nr:MULTISPECIES: AAA family ATPase [Bacillus cereus group]MEC3360539.1 AAA family ATPase [Bacillus paranthracis]MED0786618.1 AAA family ATPase [Bacillus paranthracis]MED0813185.1 AAA family ATPase [Bacillus paranthracis]MED0818897.1 AAA family ATPase [Bacillus paranthracis]MED0862259.1 AAA family ATPase [Bacillus paranthracis]